MILYMYGFLLLGVSIVLIYMIVRLVLEMYITIQGPFYAESSEQRIKDIIKLVDLKKGDKIVDLGSGDGRVIMALAKSGVTVHGYEIDPFLVRKSRKKIAKANLQDQVTVYYKSFWKQDLSTYSVIIVYGIPHVMSRLESKILKEAKKGTRIISVFFELPTLRQFSRMGDIREYKIT